MISIIVPVYNVDKYLNECIDSLIHQTYQNIEILLIDDGSTDKSSDICDVWANKGHEKIRVIHTENQGVSAARNRGIEEAKGEWLLFVDADDWVDRELCMELNHVLDEEVDICFFTFCEESERRTKKHINDTLKEGDCIIYGREQLNTMQKAALHSPMCRYTSVGSPWAKVYRKKLIDKYGVHFMLGMVKGEDHLFNLEVLEYAQKGKYLNKAYYHYRITATSARHKYNPEIIPIIRRQYEVIGDFLIRSGKEETYKQLYYNAIYRRFMIDSMIDFCHEDNPKSFFIRRKEFIDTLNTFPFLLARKNVRLNKEWAFKERMLGCVINFHLFGMLCILYKIKNLIYKAH